MSELGWWALNAVQACFLLAWSALWISVAMIAGLLRGELPLVLARRVWGPGLIRASLIPVKVEQVAPLSSTQGYMFVMNHQSMFDVPVAFAAIPVNIRFIAKSVLRYVPFLGFYMWRTGMVFVDRRRPSEAYQHLGKAVSSLRRGRSFLAYPEGTRSSGGWLEPFKRGPFLTAIQAGVPVVPVVIEGSWRALPSGTFAIRRHPVRVRLGAPIETRHFRPEEVRLLIGLVRERMDGMHRALGGQGIRGSSALEPEDRAPAPSAEARSA